MTRNASRSPTKQSCPATTLTCDQASLAGRQINVDAAQLWLGDQNPDVLLCSDPVVPPPQRLPIAQTPLAPLPADDRVTDRNICTHGYPPPDPLPSATDQQSHGSVSSHEPGRTSGHQLLHTTHERRRYRSARRGDPDGQTKNAPGSGRRRPQWTLSPMG